MTFSGKIEKIKSKVLLKYQGILKSIDNISEENTLKVLNSMRKIRVSESYFHTTSGYAYDDLGRQKLDELFAEVFGAERALVRTQFVSGTHALATVLFGILRPGDRLLSLTGAPYDTMQTVIGYANSSSGSLKEFGIHYDELSLINNRVNIESVAKAIRPDTKVAMIQRSRGYSVRESLPISEIRIICETVKKYNPNCICFVDNCYGEFVETTEPTEVGADIMAGSLIKNPGGGLAPTGGYIAGKKELVEMASCRLTAPGMGDELGASLANHRALFQGFFLAPHIVAQALKGAIFAAGLFKELGYNVWPQPEATRSDIIQAIELGTPEKLIAFCGGLQKYSPVDSFASPEPWDMPGYADQVIMAAGTFVQGASIELSADGPMRPPFNVYLQGGLTFEHAMIGIMSAAEAIENI